MKIILRIFLKTLVCGIAFFVGTMLGGMAATALGLPMPEMPHGTDANILGMYLLLVSLLIGALLAFLAARLPGGFISRWLILTALGWTVYSVSTYLESSIFTTYSSASLYKVVMDLCAFALSAIPATIFFHTSGQANRENRSTPDYPLSGWIWRLALAWAAFPVIYLTFGKIVEPFVIEVYQQGLLELTAPGWNQIIPMQLLRSLLFLLVCLPLVLRWQGSRRGLWISLSAALFLFVGGFYMLQAYWYPVWFRLIHSAEILCDSLVYGLALVSLFHPLSTGKLLSITQKQSKQHQPKLKLP